MITLSAFGRFKLSDAQGLDLTPRGMRARALLALLALAPDHRRARIWLQDKLWSERSAKQGSESLRQTLTEIRRSLGPYASALIADRETVALDRHQLKVDFGKTQVGRDPADQELFSDINVPDHEFERWIAGERMASSQEPAGASRLDRALTKKAPAIFFSLPAHSETTTDLIIAFFLALTTTSLLDFADFQIFHSDQEAIHPGLAPETGMIVRLNRGWTLGQSHLNITISDALNRRIFWSKSYQFAGDDLTMIDDDAIIKTASDTVEAVLSTFRAWSGDLIIHDCAALLVNRARQSIFRFDKQNLRQADRHLAQAYSYEPRPQILAWRAFLRNIANFQHRTTAFLADQIDIDVLAEEALREAPGSAISLGVRAHIEYLSGGSPRSSLHLARRAVDADPLNAINHAILSNTELVIGKLADSRASSLKALSLAGSAECRSFVEFFCCMSAAAMGDYQQATDHAEAALLLKPAFIAPLRYLVALYTESNRTAALKRAIALLRVSEPEFRIERLLENNYPVHTLRRIRLIETIRPQNG